MPLKLQHLCMNDIDETLQESQEGAFVPTDKQVCDDVVLLWRQEPATEDLGVSRLHSKIKERHEKWVLSERKLKQILIEHNLCFTDETKLFTYADQVTALECPHISDKHVEKVELKQSCKGRFSVFAKKDLRRDELVFYEHEPLTSILPLEKTSLAAVGRACSLCGQSLTQSTQFTMKNGLDCRMCSAVWCSKHCKKLDTTHSFLKHPMSRNKQVSASGWSSFEQFCKDNVMHAAYSVGTIHARALLDKNEGPRIKDQFEALRQISQVLRIRAADSTNIGGTFDAATGAVSLEDQSIWNKSFESFCKAFPGVEDEIDFNHYMILIGKFNLNQREGQIFTLYSYLNHNCEPNVRYELDGKTGLKLFARKDIKKGEELLTTYVNPLHGVTLRRRELLVNWGFLCDCERCNKELASREKLKSQHLFSSEKTDINAKARRKSSMKTSKPDLSELLKNGQEFNLEVPDEIGFGRRRKSVRFDDRVVAAVEE